MAEAQMHVRFAELDDKALDKLLSLEDELGSCLVAVRPDWRPARLSHEQVKRLQQAEKEMGLVLVACECQ